MNGVSGLDLSSNSVAMPEDVRLKNEPLLTAFCGR